ncbi:MAG: WecB/TagA/CpsF family glycosyltransferase [Bacillota bacterium]
MSREMMSNNPRTTAGKGSSIAEEQETRAAVPVHILGLPVNVLTMDQAVATVRRSWQEEKVFQVVTANVEMLYAGLADRELARLIREAEMVTADGAGVLLAARICGSPLPERVAGYDLMLACLREAAREAAPVFFLGARPAVLQEALARARALFPGLIISGSHHGYFQDGEGETIAAEIRLRRPRLLLVALGAPRQDKWIYRHKEKLPPCVAIGVGGSLDVLAGKARRAPRWMQRAGLEWLYRLLREPSRLARMSVIPLFLLKVTRQRFFGSH